MAWCVLESYPMNFQESDFHPPGLTFLTGVTVGHWVEVALGNNFAHVDALVPKGFAAYARLFHPARTEDHQSVRWSEVAEWAGRVAHPLMAFEGISAQKMEYGAGDQPWSCDPYHGSLDEDVAITLADFLTDFTSTPGQSYFGVWEGYGWYNPGAVAMLSTSGGVPLIPPEEVITARRLKGVDRNYLLYEGQLSSIRSFFSHRWGNAPNIWWPRDHSWFVSTDIDLDSTYVGGTEACVEGLLRHTSLEVLKTAPGAPVYMTADTINLS